MPPDRATGSATGPPGHIEESRSPNAANAATRVHAQLCAAINARDDATQRSLVARDFVQEDRRRLVAMGNQDRRGMAHNHDVMLEQGYEILPPEPIAVRGDRLALSRVPARTAGGDESVLLAINELNAEGLLARSVFFDQEDLGAAVAELDERYVGGEGAEHTAILRAASALGRAHLSRDWEAYRAMMAPDIIVEDHRSLALPDIDADGLVDVLAVDTQLAPDRVYVPRTVHVVGSAVLTTINGWGTTAEGSSYEWSFHLLNVWNVDGLVARRELFDEDDFDAALVRLHELGSHGGHAPAASDSQVRG